MTTTPMSLSCMTKNVHFMLKVQLKFDVQLSQQW